MTRQLSKSTEPRMPLRARDRQALADMFKDFDSEQIGQIETILSDRLKSDATEETVWVFGSAPTMA